MRIAYSKNFIKKSRKLDLKTRAQLIERINSFEINPLDSSLHNHQLKGAFKDYGSINIIGDCRALYLVRGDEIIFDTVGTHSELYG